MSLSDRVQELNREIGATVERALTDMRREISDRLRTSSDEVLRRLEEFSPALPGSFLAHEDLAPAADEESAGARRSAFGELRGAIAALDRSRSQSEILEALLAESSRYASRTALLLVRGGEIRGWAGRGFGDADPRVAGLTLPAAGDGAWGRLAEGRSAVRLTAADCAELSSRLESPLPREGVLVPLILRDRVAAALYADGTDDGELLIEALQILAYSAALAIESLPFRERAATPTLILEDEAPSEAVALGAWPTAAAAAPAAQPAPEAPSTPAPAAAEAAAPEPQAAAPEPAPQASAPQPWEAPRGDVEIEAEPVAAPAPAPWTVQPEPAAAAPAAPAAAPWSPAPAAPAAPPAPAAMTEELPALRDFPARTAEATAPVRLPSPDATVLLQRSALTGAAAPPEPPPVAVPAPPPLPSPLRSVAPPVAEPEPAAADPLRTPTAGGAAEVRPPSGVDGPGWAFATTRVPVSPSDEALHEEARRLARLLVSEIKLYNEDQVEEGRRNRDIYERLKEDIDRSRQMYEERVDPRILRSTDYFYQELVRILASGDSKSLGI